MHQAVVADTPHHGGRTAFGGDGWQRPVDCSSNSILTCQPVGCI